MNHELKELKAAETEALRSYSDGYEIGVNEILKGIKEAYLSVSDSHSITRDTERLNAIKAFMRAWGVDLDEVS